MQTLILSDIAPANRGRPYLSAWPPRSLSPRQIFLNIMSGWQPSFRFSHGPACARIPGKPPLMLKMNLDTLLRKPGLLLAIAVATGPAAHAALISVESFTGHTVGQQIQTVASGFPVTGYIGNWSGVDFGNSKPVVFAGSLVYSDPLYIGSSGDRVGAATTTGVEVNQHNSGRVQRLLDGSLKVTDSTTGALYLSFLFRSGQETGATIYQMLSLYDGRIADAARAFDIGITTNDSETGLHYNFGVRNTYTSTGVSTNPGVRLVVVKFALSATAGGDSVTVWIDPKLGAGEPATGGTTVGGVDLAFDRVVLSDYDGNSAAWDEIRWGATFDSVTAARSSGHTSPPAR